MKIGRNDPCFCGSGFKAKKCCLLLRAPKGGVLRMTYKISSEDSFVARMLMQIASIRDHVYKDSKDARKFDFYHKTVFDNLDEAKLARERLLELIQSHRESIAKGVDCEHLPATDQININKPIDRDLNLFFKDFFIRGRIALDGLVGLARFAGFEIKFIFQEEKNFEAGKALFVKKYPNLKAEAFLKFIEKNRVAWLSTFISMRIGIEHKGFQYPSLKYFLTPQNTIKPMFPSFYDHTTEEIINISWDNIISFCEDIIVFVLEQNLPEGFALYEIPKDKRDKLMPVKYKVSLNPVAMAKMKKAMEDAG